MKNIIASSFVLLLMGVSLYAAPNSGIDYSQVAKDTMLQNTKELFLAIPASDTDNILSATNATVNLVTYKADGVAAGTVITQPRLPMTIQLRVSDNAKVGTGNALRGTIFVSGLDARGNKVSEKFAYVSASATTKTFYSFLAFSRITNVDYDKTWLGSVTPTDTISIGYHDKVGLLCPININTDVYKITQVTPSMTTTTSVGVLSVVNITTANVNPSGNYYEGLGSRYSRTSVFKPATTGLDYELYYRQGKQ